jgi:hypothetical protein
MTFDDIKSALAAQAFQVFRNRLGDLCICDASGYLVAVQPGSESKLRGTVFLALVNAGFVWPWP